MTNNKVFWSLITLSLLIPLASAGIELNFPKNADCGITYCEIIGNVVNTYGTTICIDRAKLKGQFPQIVKAKSVRYWGNVEETVPTYGWIEKSYTCDYDFSYTTSPNYAWCWYTDGNGTNRTVFEHHFDTGNMGTKTIYWIEWGVDGYDVVIAQDWKTLPSQICFGAGSSHDFKLAFNVPANSAGKFNITVQLPNGSIYLLDPFWNSSIAELNIIVDDTNTTAYGSITAGEKLGQSVKLRDHLVCVVEVFLKRQGDPVGSVDINWSIGTVWGTPLATTGNLAFTNANTSKYYNWTFSPCFDGVGDYGGTYYLWDGSTGWGDAGNDFNLYGCDGGAGCYANGTAYANGAPNAAFDLSMILWTMDIPVPAILFNHPEINSSINYADVNISVATTTTSNLTACNLTFDGTIYTMALNTTETYYYEMRNISEGNHTYNATCTSQIEGQLNSTLGWTYINLPLNMSWDWDGLNTTVNSSTIIWVNTSNASACTLNFNHTNYTMTSSIGNRFFYNMTLTSGDNGNYTHVYTTCNDSLNNTNSTTIGWLNVSVTDEPTLFSYYCEPFVRVGNPFIIWVDYTNFTGGDLFNATITISNATVSYNLTYSVPFGRFQEYFSSSIPLTWRINITASLAGYESQTGNCTIRITEWFNITHTLWLLREYDNNGTKIYHQRMNERYLNDFAYLIMRLEDIEITSPYEYNCSPVEPPIQELFEGVQNWGWDFGGSGDFSLFEDYLGCNKYYFHAPLVNGEANISLPWAGNYSMWLISGVMSFENPYAPPDIESFLGVWKPFETAYYNGTYTSINWGLTTWDLDFWGTLSNELFIFLIGVMPFLIGFGLYMLTGDFKFAISISTLYSIYILLQRGGIL